MQRYLILLCSIFLTSIVGVKAQSKSEKAFKLALEYNYYYDYDSAIYYLQPLLKNKKSKVYVSALYEAGTAYFGKRDYLNAEKYFRDFLRSDYEKIFVFKDPNDIRFNSYPDIMHSSAYDYLTEIYIRTDRFQTALDTMKHTCKLENMDVELCSYALNSSSNSRLMKMSKCFNALNLYDSTILLLWKNMFQYSFSENTELTDLLIEALERKYSKEKLLKEVVDAEYRIKLMKENNEDLGYIHLFGKSIRLPDDHYSMGTIFYLDIEDFYAQKGLERMRCIYTGSYFYRKITSIGDFVIYNKYRKISIAE